MDESSETKTPITSVFQNALSPKMHEQLDRNLLPMADVHFNNAAWILETVLQYSITPYSNTTWPINPAAITTEACEAILASNPELRGLLQEAHSSGRYFEIRNRRKK
jgi:hypothetical protein